MMALSEIVGWQREVQQSADMLGLEVDAISMYQAFYEQHKEKHGSFKKYIGTDQYGSKMDERYDFIICCMNEVLESKQNYEIK